MKNSNLLTLVSQITLVLNCEISVLMPKKNIYGWNLKNGEIHLDLSKNEIQLINEPDINDNTFFALYGIAYLNDLKIESYFSN